MDMFDIILFQDSEREFVVTHNADIKPVSYFTGRETELKDLRQRIEDGRKSVLVSGMGGIGKTQICRKLFDEYSTRNGKGENDPFKYIGYIKYDGDMGSSLMNGLKYWRQDDPRMNQEAAWRELEYLASGGKLLLFVDNVDKPISADQGLQRLSEIPGAVILTSRQTSFGDEFEAYRIGFLDIEQSKEIYGKIRYRGSEKNIKPEEDQDLEYVIDKLAGMHTMTVQFLADLSRTKSWTVKRLRRELEEKRFCLEFHKDGEFVNMQKSYEVLYDLSELTDAEQNILEAFSVFPYIPLEAETCNEWLLADAGVSENDDVLMGLYQKGWLQFDMDQESYVLHPVFAQFIYEKCKPELERHCGLIKGCQKCLEIPEDGFDLECQKYIPFAESIVEKVDMEQDMRYVSFISSIAYLLHYIVGCKQAEELYKKGLCVSEKVLGEEHPYTAAIYNNLASVYESQGEHKQAEELCKKGLYISEKVLGEEHPSTIMGYDNLASVYEEQGKYKQAEELYKKGLRIREKVLGEEHPDTITGYDNLASVYHSQGEYKQAEELYKKGLRISKKVLGGEHPYTVTNYNNLAVVYESQGEYKQAEKLYKIGLRISKKVSGEEHLDTAISYNNLACVYGKQGKYKHAEKLYKKGLRICEKVLGEEHPDTATSYNNLASVYESQGKYKQAEELYKKGLRINEKVLGEEHPDTATGYNNLAGVYYNQGEYEQAEELYKKGLRVKEKVLGEEHPSTATSYNNLAAVYESQGEYKKAEELYKKGLLIRQKVLGEEHPSTANSYNNVASLYFEQGRYEIALIFCFKAYEICVNKLGLEHPYTKEICKNMEMVYLEWNPEGDFEQWLGEKMKGDIA